MLQFFASIIELSDIRLWSIGNKERLQGKQGTRECSSCLREPVN